MFQTCQWTHNTTSGGFMFVPMGIQPLAYSVPVTLVADNERNKHLQVNDTRRRSAVWREKIDALLSWDLRDTNMRSVQGNLHILRGGKSHRGTCGDQTMDARSQPGSTAPSKARWPSVALVRKDLNSKNWVRPVEQKPTQSSTMTLVKISGSTEQLGWTGEICCLDYLLHYYY